jgi:hypothetical protein
VVVWQGWVVLALPELLNQQLEWAEVQLQSSAQVNALDNLPTIYITQVGGGGITQEEGGRMARHHPGWEGGCVAWL